MCDEFLVGVANTAYSCGDGPAVYTRLSGLYEWIRDNADAPTTTPTTTSTTTKTSTTPSMSSIQIECSFFCISFALVMLILGILN